MIGRTLAAAAMLALAGNADAHNPLDGCEEEAVSYAVTLEMRDETRRIIRESDRPSRQHLGAMLRASENAARDANALIMCFLRFLRANADGNDDGPRQ